MKSMVFVSMNVAPVGGLGADLIKCIRGSCKQGREVHVIYGFKDPATDIALADHHIHWHKVLMPKRPPVFAQVTLWIRALRYIKKIEKNAPNITAVCFERLPLGDIQVGTAPNSLWMAARKRMGLSRFSKIPYRIWCWAMDRIIHTKCTSKIIVFSNRDAKALKDRGVSQGRIVRVVIPTDTCRFSPTLQNTERKYVTIIGAHPQLKGIDLALKVWPEIYKQHPELTLRIVTHGWKVPKTISSSHKGVDIAPFISDVEKYYHSSRLVLMPSMFETWGNVVPEALACGVPVVASSDVPSSEMISSPEMGVVFDREGLNRENSLSVAVNKALGLSMTEDELQHRHQIVSNFFAKKINLVEWIITSDGK